MVSKIQAFRADAQGVVIAGNGHVRKDYGMPNHIDQPHTSIGLVEVVGELKEVLDYAPERYDFVWFSPRLDDIDACEKYKEALRKMNLRFKSKTGKAKH